MNEIKFYHTGDPYGNFSNFAAFPIFLNGKSWPTVEHYFQAAKFEDEALKEKLREISSPMEVAKEGRKRKYPLRENWEEVKEKVMALALWAKFLQHPQLREELLSTGQAKIIEHTRNDAYWGDGGDGSGKNRLGTLLVEAREALRKINKDPKLTLPPWLAFPHIDSKDMFWRMGIGENYMYLWSRYYLSHEDQMAYQSTFPPTGSWKGFYD